MARLPEEREAIRKQRLEYNASNKLIASCVRKKKSDSSLQSAKETIDAIQVAQEKMDARQAAKEREVENAIELIRAQKMSREVPDGRKRYEVPAVRYARQRLKKRR